MANLSDLAEMEHEDPEYVPEILPVDARLSIKGSVLKLRALFERAAAVVPQGKEVVPGTQFALLNAVQTSSTEVAHVRITASDGEQTVSVVQDGVDILMSGSVLLPPKRINDILKLSPSHDVKLEVIGNACIIRAGRAQWTVQVPVGDELGLLPDVEDLELHDVPVGPLLNALVIVRRAAADKDSRASMKQVLIRNRSVTAMDGGRLHRKEVEGLDPTLDLTLPVGATDEVIRALQNTDSEFAQLGYNDRHFVFRIDQDSIVGLRLIADFPPIEKLMLGPAFSNIWALAVETEELVDTIKRVRINADPDYAAIYLRLISGKKTDDGKLTWSLAVRARDRMGNGSQEVISCQWNGNKAVELCLNHHYLSDLLVSHEGDWCVLRVGDDTASSKSPLLLEDKSVGFTGIVQQSLPSVMG